MESIFGKYLLLLDKNHELIDAESRKISFNLKTKYEKNYGIKESNEYQRKFIRSKNTSSMRQLEGATITWDFIIVFFHNE